MTADADTRDPAAAGLVDQEEADAEEEATWQSEAAQAEALVETALNIITIECRRCFHRFEKDAMQYDAQACHDVCKDEAACMARAPTGRRKRARPDFAQMQHGR